MPVDTLSCPPELQNATASMIDTLAGPEPNVTNRDEWLKIIDNYINKWWYELSAEEEGFEPPTKNVLLRAESLVKDLSKQYVCPPPPSRVVPNGEGGIIFERYEHKGNDNIYEALEISVNLEIEYSRYENSKLIHINNLTS